MGTVRTVRFQVEVASSRPSFTPLPMFNREATLRRCDAAYKHLHGPGSSGPSKKAYQDDQLSYPCHRDAARGLGPLRRRPCQCRRAVSQCPWALHQMCRQRGCPGTSARGDASRIPAFVCRTGSHRLADTDCCCAHCHLGARRCKTGPRTCGEARRRSPAQDHNRRASDRIAQARILLLTNQRPAASGALFHCGDILQAVGLHCGRRRHVTLSHYKCFIFRPSNRTCIVPKPFLVGLISLSPPALGNSSGVRFPFPSRTGRRTMKRWLGSRCMMQ